MMIDKGPTHIPWLSGTCVSFHLSEITQNVHLAMDNINIQNHHKIDCSCYMVFGIKDIFCLKLDLELSTVYFIMLMYSFWV